MIDALLNRCESAMHEHLAISDSRANPLQLDVRQHGGTLSEAEITDVSFNRFAAFLSCANFRRLSEPQAGSQVASRSPYLLTLVCVFAASGGSAEQRRLPLLSASQQFARLLEKDQRFNFPAHLVDPARLIDSRNVYSAQADKRGIALWLCSWSHVVGGLSAPEPAGLLHELHRAHAESETQTGAQANWSTAHLGDLHPHPHTDPHRPDSDSEGDTA